MSTFKSTTFASQEDAGNRADKIIADAALICGSPRKIQMELTVPSGTATGDTIQMGYLPAGLTVVPGSVIHCNAAGGDTFDLGVPDNTDALASTVPTAAGAALVNPENTAFKSTKRQEILLTLNGALTAGRVITLQLACVIAE